MSQTPTLPHEKADNFSMSLLTQQDGVMIREEHKDGSVTTFRLCAKDNHELVRCGKDSTVMLKTIMNDGSWLTQTVATEFYENNKTIIDGYCDN